MKMFTTHDVRFCWAQMRIKGRNMRTISLGTGILLLPKHVVNPIGTGPGHRRGYITLDNHRY